MKTSIKYLITGGSGFIGINLITELLKESNIKILNIDKLSYASKKKSLKFLNLNKNYKFLKIDLYSSKSLNKIISDFAPNVIFHLAAESHVDRSISSAKDFINSNIVGTFNLLESTRVYLNNLDKKLKKNFKFIYISTDEVFGDLRKSKKLFNEKSNYNPSSPYSATKASADHLVRAWLKTYKLPSIITHCSNNYGPFQFPEKLIPMTIFNALHKKKIPIYGNGNQTRNWIYVEDHVRALIEISKRGKIGESYCIGTRVELKNIQIVEMICDLIDSKRLNSNFSQSRNLIKFVKDRPGHDTRYSISSNKIFKEIGWKAKINFKQGIIQTIDWYLKNQNWLKKLVRK